MWIKWNGNKRVNKEFAEVFREHEGTRRKRRQKTKRGKHVGKRQ